MRKFRCQVTKNENIDTSSYPIHNAVKENVITIIFASRGRIITGGLLNNNHVSIDPDKIG